MRIVKAKTPDLPVAALLVAALLAGPADGQETPAAPAAPAPAAAPEAPSPPRAPVERLDENRVRVGAIVVDQTRQELSVAGTVNSATVLEYLANAEEGYKSYESALELDCSAVEFNTALILLGLDPEHGVPSRRKFDPEPPQGDPVEVWVEWQAGGETVRRRGADLLYDVTTGETLTPGPWVYTGSVFLDDGRYLADLDGVLIGFMHTPESIIDSPRPLESAWGDVERNPELGLEPGMPVRLVVRRLAAGDG